MPSDKAPITFLAEREDTQRVRDLAKRERVPVSIVLRRLLRRGLDQEQRNVGAAAR